MLRVHGREPLGGVEQPLHVDENLVIAQRVLVRRQQLGQAAHSLFVDLPTVSMTSVRQARNNWSENQELERNRRKKGLCASVTSRLIRGTQQ